MPGLSFWNVREELSLALQRLLDLGENTADSHSQSMGEICPIFQGRGLDAQHQRRKEKKKREEEYEEESKGEAERGYGRM